MCKKVTLILFLFLVAFLAVACTAPEEPQETVAINLPMGYIADPQYAPFYVAMAEGYFAEEGLDISFDYSFETDGMALVGANERPFAIVSGGVATVVATLLIAWRYPVLRRYQGESTLDERA